MFLRINYEIKLARSILCKLINNYAIIQNGLQLYGN